MNSRKGWVIATICLFVTTACGTGVSGAGADGSPSSRGSQPAPGSLVTGRGDASTVPSATGVQGKVEDSKGEPVVSATVLRAPLDRQELPLTQQAAVTDLDGRYAWTLAPGRWEITISAPGFETAKKPALVVEGERATLNFELHTKS